MSTPRNGVLNTARNYLTRGWCVVPIPVRKKAPVTEGWQNLRLTDDELPHHFTKSANVGVLLGGPSGGLIDVDLDHPDAVALGDQYLPPTPAEFGRASKPRSHRLFVVTAPIETVKRQCKLSGRKLMNCEIRSTGCQTVFPGSIHPSGERIEWHVSGDPAMVDPADLLACFHALADEVERRNGVGPRRHIGTAKPVTRRTQRVGTSEVERARRYLAKIPPAISGQGGHNTTFHAACVLVLGFGLDREPALGLLREWNAMCQPPWSEKELAHKIDDALQQQGERGYLLIDRRATAQTDMKTAATRKRAKTPKQSQADRLVELAQAAELFHSPGQDGDGYATVAIGDPPHRETWPIRSKRFRQWLARRLYEGARKVPCAQALVDAVNALSGQAVFNGQEHPIAVRVAEHDSDFWLDLADDKWQAVRITPHGWQVVSSSPVRFVRAGGMLALPEPTPAVQLAALRRFLNVPDNDQWALLAAWMVAAVRRRGPFPVLVVNGEQGSAKSTLCRFVRDLIDPNTADLRAEPRDVRDLMIAASNGWIIAFDNLSRIQPALSDAICRLATGGGFATRELFTDGDERLFDSTRPVMFNGIEELATRPDLLDRAITLMLPTIRESARRTEREMKAAYQLARPAILGGLLDAVAAGMRNLPDVRLDSFPRMADFAEWAVAAEPALGLQPGEFLAAYSGNRANSHDIAIESSPFGIELLRFVQHQGFWQGTAAELMADVNETVDERTQRGTSWPKTPKALSGQLRRLAPNLRAVGINVTLPARRQGHAKRPVITLEQPDAGLAAQAAAGETPAESTDSAAHCGHPAANCGPFATDAGLAENRRDQLAAACAARAADRRPAFSKAPDDLHNSEVTIG